MTTVLYHWWPSCPLWPLDEESDDSGPETAHEIAHTRDQVTCPHCRRDPAVTAPPGADDDAEAT